jgi:ABC-type bacteriocin/lantibiotic exporter with double-glycine peptidase domain
MKKTTKTIIVKPGEELTLTIKTTVNGERPTMPSIVRNPTDRIVLPVPYFSQWGPTATWTANDCGPACITMVVHYLTEHTPTVDDVSGAAGIEKNAESSNFGELATACRRYGVKAQYVRPLRRVRIEEEIANDHPILTLVKYDMLGTAEDPNQDDFAGAHFVIIAGFDKNVVLIHDPDRLRGDDFGEFREVPWDQFLKAMASVHLTKGNDHSNHGMLFDV